MNFKIRQTLGKTPDTSGLITGFEGHLGCNGHSDRAVFKLPVQSQMGFVCHQQKPCLMELKCHWKVSFCRNWKWDEKNGIKQE